LTNTQSVVVCGVIFVDEIKKFLVPRRHDTMIPDMHNMYYFPGGKVEWGESPEEAIERELKEELGITDLCVMGFIPLVQSQVFTRNDGENRHIILLPYLIYVPTPIGIQNLDDTHSALDWFTAQELVDLPDEILLSTARRIFYTLKSGSIEMFMDNVNEFQTKHPELPQWGGL
jgi:8-oxo-dGTP pyrophosphatase MutT (NUDIX family)